MDKNNKILKKINVDVAKPIQFLLESSPGFNGVIKSVSQYNKNQLIKQFTHISGNFFLY